MKKLVLLVVLLVLMPTIVVAQNQPILTALTYDEDSQHPLAAGQTRYVAVVIREAQAALREATTDDMAQEVIARAVVEIQQMAEAVRATRLEGASVTVPWPGTWLAWCSNVDGATAPADVNLPLGFGHRGHGSLFIWALPAYDATPDPIDLTFGTCQGGQWWLVAIQ